MLSSGLQCSAKATVCPGGLFSDRHRKAERFSLPLLEKGNDILIRGGLDVTKEGASP
jgi:hypothetical protein